VILANFGMLISNLKSVFLLPRHDFLQWNPYKMCKVIPINIFINTSKFQSYNYMQFLISYLILHKNKTRVLLFIGVALFCLFYDIPQTVRYACTRNTRLAWNVVTISLSSFNQFTVLVFRLLSFSFTNMFIFENYHLHHLFYDTPTWLGIWVLTTVNLIRCFANIKGKRLLICR